MRKIIVFLLLLYASHVYGQYNRSFFLSELNEWYFQRGNHSIKLYDIEDYLNEENVEITTKTYELFSKDFYDLTRTSDVYCCEVEIEGITKKVLAVLLYTGSGRFPWFYLFVYNDSIKKYQLKLESEKDLYPILINDKYYFVERTRDYDSGRYYKYSICEITSAYVVNELFVFEKRYEYPLNKKLLEYISSDEINMIAEQDYRFLGVFPRKPELVEVDFGNYTFISYIHYTSVGYHATNMDLIIQHNGKEYLKYIGIWGFNIKKNKQGAYLVILSMDDENPYACIVGLNIEIIDLANMEIVENMYTEPIESFY